MTTVGIAGLTHLGINTGAALASKGFRVVAWDPELSRIERLKAGDPIVSEPGLQDLLTRHRDQLVFSSEVVDLGAADMVYIATDVPTDAQGISQLDGIQALMNQVIESLNPNAILTILCQVPPGFTRRQSYPHDRLFYQVETLIFGRAVERAVSPERYIIGCADPAQPLPGPLREVLSAGECPVLPMRYESAELAKISINCFLVAQVATTNTLAEICENIGADWSEIAPSLRLDGRIGPRAYLAPGLGISGGNLERDLATVTALSRTNATEAGTVDAWRVNSEWRKDWLIRTLEQTLPPITGSTRIAVLGLAYKENTDSIKNSPSIAFLRRLEGKQVRAHDPVVAPGVTPEWVEVTVTAMDACADADVLVVATAWPEYGELSLAAIAARMPGRVLIDPYGVFESQDPVSLGFDWHRLGAGRVDGGAAI